jgi:hypothetical protein
MHSLFFMFSLSTISFTSKLMGHFFEHWSQPMQLFLFDFKRSLGSLNQSDTFVPITINGAIQHTLWQNPRFPIVSASTTTIRRTP